MCLCVAENACVNAHCIFIFECMGFCMCAHESVCMLCMNMYTWVWECVCACFCYLHVYVHISMFIFVNMSMFVFMCAFLSMHL